MNTFPDYKAAVIGLHEQGYCCDFVLFGDELLWIQEKIFIASNDFEICECYQFAHPNGNDEDLVVFGISLKQHDVKGILMNHYSYTSPVPVIITRKLDAMGFYSVCK
jgi:hypothetical protein